MTTPADHPVLSFRAEVADLVRRMRRALPLVSRRHKLLLALATGLMVVNGVFTTAIPVLLGRLVNGLASLAGHTTPAGDVLRLASLLLAGLAGVYLARELLLAYQKYLVDTSCTRIERDLTVVLVSHLFKADLAALARERVGALQRRIARSVEGFVESLTLQFTQFLPGLVTIAVTLGWVFVREYRVGLVILATLPAILALSLRQIRTQKGTRLGLLRNHEELEGTIAERLAGIEYIRAAHTHSREVDRVERVAEQQRAAALAYYLTAARYECVKALTEGLFHLLVLALAVYLAVSGSIPFGDVLTFSLLFYAAAGPLKEMCRLLDHAHDCSLRVDDLLQVLSSPPDPSFTPVLTRDLTMLPRVAALRPAGGPPPLHPDGPVVFRGAPVVETQDLVVEYLSRDGRRRRALDGVTLTISHGETVGAVGRSGSGKSTWLKVLLRLVPPTAGEVRLGGVSLEGVSRDAIGRLFGYVSQAPFLFAGTVAENIAYGCDGATPEGVRRAAERAGIHDEILALPGGYQAHVSERGLNLSGGQRQRVALARVLLKDPPVLILDEGTSALDTLSEAHVQRAIAEARADRTVILVAHRLSTLRDAPRILVFDSGRVIESGSFDELVRLEGLFARLARGAEAAP